MILQKVEMLIHYNKKPVLDKWTNYTNDIKINKTHPLIFKDQRLNNGKAYYSCAIIWCDVTNNKGNIFTGRIYDVYNNNHDSRMYIRRFPFLPKTFKIKIIQSQYYNKYKIIDDDILYDVYKIYDPIDEEWII